VAYKDNQGAELRDLRQQLEKYHAPAADPEKALELIWANLNHKDRFIRYAARVALEFQPVKLWQDRVLNETEPVRLIEGAVALARQGEASLEPKLVKALEKLDFSSLPENQQLDLLRAYSLVFIRLGEPSKEVAASLGKKLEAYFPAKSDSLNRELCALLVYLKDPLVVAKTVAMLKAESKPLSDEAVKEVLARNPGYGNGIAKMLANAPDLQKLYYLFVLRNSHEPWTVDQRKAYFSVLGEMRQKSGGASYQGFLTNIEKDAFDNAPDADRLVIEASGLRKPYVVRELPKPEGPGRDWKLDELVRFVEPKLKGRDFKNGQKMFAAARCVVCHRFNSEGGATGPDLTQVAGRFSLKDLCESIVEPSKVIADQYRSLLITTSAGKPYNGRIIGETKDRLTLLIDPEDSTKVVELKKSDIEETKPSPVSLMPDGLLKQLNENEVLDLIAYMLSRGDPGHAMFRK
jgi:putative heme-binding domain-containing protein